MSVIFTLKSPINQMPNVYSATQSGISNPWRAKNMIGRAEELRLVLVVCLTSTSGMSILQTVKTSHVQKNCYKLVAHFNVRCLFSFFFFFLPFSLLPLHIMAFTAMGRALAAPINKGEVGSGLFHPSLSWSCVCGAGGSERAGFIHVPSSHPPVGTSHSH